MLMKRVIVDRKMFIQPTRKTWRGKSYTRYLVVQSVRTPQGPRHQVICSLGTLAPTDRAERLSLAHGLESELAGQTSLWPDPRVESTVEKLRLPRGRPSRRSPGPGRPPHGWTDQIEIREARPAGAVHVGHHFWQRLGLDTILRQAGLDPRAQWLTELMTLNRLIAPASEHAMPDWVRRTALGDILQKDLASLYDEVLYRTLDQLHPRRVAIEAQLAARERQLFQLQDTIYLYDLTSTYFEGQCAKNPKARYGYSRDHRPDCKQVVVGLVLDGEGFPKAHEVFEGNRADSTTLEAMLTVLEQRVGGRKATVVVDRGLVSEENLQRLRARGHHYLVTARQSERHQHQEEFEAEEGWEEVQRSSSPQNPAQKKSRVFLKRGRSSAEVQILCVSEERQQKERAVRQLQDKRLVLDLEKLSARVAQGRLRNPVKVSEAIGRLKQRYPRVARYYEIVYHASPPQLRWREQEEKKRRAEQLDGGYLLKTDRQDLTPEEIWRTYLLLNRAESAFRAMKSPRLERPIFHQLERRVETHIFLCVLAYHLLVSIEKTLRDRGLHTSWESIRERLSTHQVVTVVLPTSEGEILRIRKATTPEPEHRQIYQTLGVPEMIVQPTKASEPM
jgi:transposase